LRRRYHERPRRSAWEKTAPLIGARRKYSERRETGRFVGRKYAPRNLEKAPLATTYNQVGRRGVTSTSAGPDDNDLGRRSPWVPLN